MRNLIFILSLLASADATFDIPVWSVDNSVTKSQSTTFTLSSTIGQPESGVVMHNGSYKLSGGFWFPSSEQDVCMAPIIMYLLD